MEEKNQKIAIVADEGGDLPKELIEKYEIGIVPFKVDLGEMKDLPGNIYQKIKEAEKKGLKSFIKTSQPSPGDFLKMFQEKLKKSKEIICLTITSKHSGTYNSALQAREFLKEKERVHVVDSLNGTGGEGLIILKTAQLIEQGLKIKEILEKLKETIHQKTHLIVCLKDSKWLESSGRVPSLVGFGLKGMQKLGIFPFLILKKGKISPTLKKIKSISEALSQEFIKKISHIDFQEIKIAITHADNKKEALKLKEILEKIKNCKIVFINQIGEILGGLAGPGTVALSWQYE